ncbi:hypothetical protein MKX03_014558 [Papaver bracteatum]|nr:hypothetical protein MKX03_014558 [Papaver bracteatum]
MLLSVASRAGASKRARKRSDVLETLTPDIRKRVEILREIQIRHNTVKADSFVKRAEIVAEYQKMCEPLYLRRYSIVNGVSEVDGDGVTKEVEADKNAEEKGVPYFWLNAMKANKVLRKEITKRDEDPLKYLKDISWCRIHTPVGFQLDFQFHAENPYFKNLVLTKTYHLIDDVELILEEKNLTQLGSSACENFFNFFESEYGQCTTPEQAKELQNKMDHDYYMGSILRDKIIPHAVSWFTGEAAAYPEYNEDNDMDDDMAVRPRKVKICWYPFIQLLC